MKLALGTVQFGLPYGIANSNGQIDRTTAEAILRRARSEGLETLDTAIAYGESEQCLGEVGVDGWRVISKLPQIPEDCPDIVDWVKGQVLGSLSRLKVTQLAGLLLHRPSQLLELNGKVLWDTLQKLKLDGIVEKIGFSIYEPGELNALWCSFHPDLVQAPYNILDRRLTTSGWLQRMDEAGVEVHVRSVFLQGLLLMPSASRHAKFNRWHHIWNKWERWLQETGLSPLEACLRYALSTEGIDKVVVGVDSVSHLREILAITGKALPSLPEWPTPIDADLINPSCWNNL